MGKYSLKEKREFAEHMRHNPTFAEKTMWWKLSRNQFGYRFMRQVPLCGYIVDFYCSRLRMVVELDGSVHEIEDVAADDEQRERVLESHGFLVLRFSNEDVLDHMTVVLTRLWDECSARRIALKAFDPRSVLGKRGRDASAYSRPCESVQKPSASATVGKTSVDSTPQVPATAEDYAAINQAWRKLVVCSRQRSLDFNNATLTDAGEVALRTFNEKHKLDEWLKKRQMSAHPLDFTEAQSLTFKGMDVTEKKA